MQLDPVKRGELSIDAARAAPQGGEPLDGSKQKRRFTAGGFEDLIGRTAHRPFGDVAGDRLGSEERAAGFTQRRRV